MPLNRAGGKPGYAPTNIEYAIDSLTRKTMPLLIRTEHATYRPYKGDCSYYSIPAAGDRGGNAVCTYEDAYLFAASIRGLLAFYSNRVDTIGVRT